MPALSPTMTEGNIANWKINEGDSFQAGDILLEIETDKATMDVEAQDAGVLVKIFQGDGSKAVKVGTRIAVLGEEGDDPKSLEIPENDTKSASQPKQAKEEKSESGEQEVQDQKSQDSKPEKKSFESAQRPSGPAQNKKYPLYPSVIALIHENHIPESDIEKISASGPNGRLLKGDVLAYLGAIPSDYSSKQSSRIQHLSHLDLSNIKLAEKAPPKPADTPAAAGVASILEPPPVSTISLAISLSAVLATQKRIETTLGVTIPLSTFLARATDLANDDLPRTKASLSSPDDLFNAVLGLDVLNSPTSRGTYMPQISAFPPPSSIVGSSTPVPSRKSTQPDIIDILSGKAKPSPSSRHVSASSSKSSLNGSASSTGGALNLFSVTVPKGEERRARTFLERVKTVLQVEPGRLVL